MITVDDLQGHWRRDWIKAQGFEDHTTRVHWMQAGTLFADIRVPLDRPALDGATCLADLPPNMIKQLLQAEGFAGTISVDQDRCTWRREITWHGVPEMDDIGRMSFDGEALIEDGVLATYREQWRRAPDQTLRGFRVQGGGMAGILIETDSTFLFAIGPSPQTHSGPASRDQLRTHFASVYALGSWSGDEGIAKLCTNPFCEGRTVLTRGASTVWHATDFDGDQVTYTLTLSAVKETQNAH